MSEKTLTSGPEGNDPLGELGGPIALEWVEGGARKCELVGQSSSLCALRGAILLGARKGEGGQKPPPITIVGPFGCGKATAAKVASQEAGLPFGEVDLAHPSQHAVAYRAAEALKFGNGVVLIRNLHKCSPEDRLQVAQAIALDVIPCVVDRRRVDAPGTRLQFVVSVSGYQVVGESHSGLICPWEMPTELQIQLRQGPMITFGDLSRQQIFEILARPGCPQLAAISEQLGLGNSVEFSEMAIYEWIDRAAARFPHMNMRGIERELEEFTIASLGISSQEYGGPNE